MDRILQDLRYALRTLRRSPGFTLVAVLTLALGIGVNAAMFSVIDGVLLRALPYAEPDGIVRVLHDAPENGTPVTPGAFSPQDFEDLQRETTAYTHLAAYLQNDVILTGGRPEELQAGFVSAEFFAVLGVSPQLGRVPAQQEHVAGADRVAVLSDGFWRRRFSADSGVIGRNVSIDGEPFTVVGVMPPSFAFPSPDAELWVPVSRIGDDDIPHQRDLRWLGVIGRLAPGETPATAATATEAALRQLEEAYPDSNEGWSDATVMPLREALVGDVRPALLVLLGAVAVILLIACANLANLLLARGNARGRELAVRTALGANRARVMRQLLTESVALALLGGACGLALAFIGIDALVALSAGTVPRPDDIELNARVAGFTLAASVLTGIVFGLIPSLNAARVNVNEALVEGGRSGTEGRRGLKTRALLVVAQVALAVVLLSGAGLLIRSFWNLTQVDPGFESGNVLALSIATPSEILESERRNAYREEIITRIGNLPGVTAVGGSKTVPLQGGGEAYAFFVPGRAESVTPEAGVFPVTPGYFDALGIPLLQGRAFTQADEANGAPVLIVNRAMAQRYLPEGEAVGASLGFLGTEFRIVGVVGDVRHDGIAADPEPAIYIPSAIMPRTSLQLFVRTSVDPAQLADAVRQVIWDINPDQPVAHVMTMREVIGETIARPRFFTLLLGGFSALAVVLAAVGVYGVIAYSVSRRTQELGIRMALGAKGADVVRLILFQGMAPTLLGLLLGLAGALALTRVLSSQLFGVGAADPLTFALVALLLFAIAALASYIPARRAVRVDPMRALRSE